MKEWALKHPIMTFLLIDSAIAGVVNIIRAFSPAAKACKVDEAEKPAEEKEEE